MVKYRLSKNIEIVSAADYAGFNIPEKYHHDHYILIDNLNNRDFLINDTIKYFIDKFSLPKTPTEVLDEVATDIKSSKNAIEKKCSSFLKLLCKRKIVVPENLVEKNNSRQPLFKVGDFIGNLCIQNIIADKHNVDIYLVLDNTDNKSYVIKLLNPDKAQDKKTFEEDLLDLKYEYAMLTKAKHIPAICQTFGLQIQADQPPHIILEYIEGKSLTRFLRQAENIKETDCYCIIENLLEGFSLLHESNLIHGDIHPSNILVKENKHIKIIDMGLSTVANFEKDEMIRFGGVQYYMPPERINISSHDKFSKEPDFYSDVYQIGILIYIIFYLKDPCTGFIWEELAQNIKEGRIEYPELSFLNFHVPTKAIELMKKCVHKNPVRRYENAGKILEDFRKIRL